MDSNLGAVTLVGDTSAIRETSNCPAVGGVQYFASQTADVALGNAYELSWTATTCGDMWSVNSAAWIDYNQDLEFEESELIYNTSDYGTKTIRFTVPQSASVGVTRLRVQVQETVIFPLDPCSNFTYGGTKDFPITVGANECLNGTQCGPNATCINTPQGFDCPCQTGFTQNGSNCDPVDCGYIPGAGSDMNFGSCREFKLSFGDSCDYACDGGYTPSGSLTLACLANQTYTTLGTCQGVPCGPLPAAPLNTNSINCSLDLRYPASCDYQCNSGYEQTGSLTLKCLSSGQYGAVSACQGVSCGSIPTVPSNANNGTCGSRTTLSYPDSCAYKCEPGFILAQGGNLDVTCRANRTYATLDACVVDTGCGPIPQLPAGTNNGSCANVSSLPVNQTCDYECDAGYSHVSASGSLTLACNADRSYSKLGFCAGISCGSLPTLSSNMSAGNCTANLTYPETCNYKCSPGYAASQATDLTRRCLSNGSYTAVGSCRAIGCGTIPTMLPFNAVSENCTQGLVLSYPDQCNYKCNAGFLSTGNLAVQCRTDGTYAPTSNCASSCPGGYVQTSSSTCTKCSQFATFSQNPSRCQCNAGFTGNGYTCTLTPSTPANVYQGRFTLSGVNATDPNLGPAFVAELARVLNVSVSRISLSGVKILNSNSASITFLLLPPSANDTRPSSEVGNDLIAQVNDPSSALYQSPLLQHVLPPSFKFSLIQLALAALFAQLSPATLVGVLIGVLFVVAMFFVYNHYYYPGSASLRIVSLFLSYSAFICNCYFAYFLGTIRHEEDVFAEWVVCIIALTLPSFLNLLYAGKLLVKEMYDQHEFLQWVKSHSFMMMFVYMSSFLNMRNLRILTSKVFGFQCTDAKISPSKDLHFAWAGLISTLLGDIPLAAAQIAFSVRFSIYRRNGLLGLVFTLLNLTLAFLSRLYDYRVYKLHKNVSKMKQTDDPENQRETDQDVGF